MRKKSKSSLTLIFSRRIRYLPTSLQDIRQSLFSAECITINGSADFVKKCRTVLQNRKTVFVFAVWDDAPENIPSDSLKNKYLANIVISPDSCLAVEGQIDKSKVSFGQKLSLSGMKKKLMKKENKDDRDFSIIGMIDGYSGGFEQEAADRVAAVIKSMT